MFGVYEKLKTYFFIRNWIYFNSHITQIKHFDDFGRYITDKVRNCYKCYKFNIISILDINTCAYLRKWNIKCYKLESDKGWRSRKLGKYHFYCGKFLALKGLRPIKGSRFLFQFWKYFALSFLVFLERSVFIKRKSENLNRSWYFFSGKSYVFYRNFGQDLENLICCYGFFSSWKIVLA